MDWGPSPVASTSRLEDEGVTALPPRAPVGRAVRQTPAQQSACATTTARARQGSIKGKEKADQDADECWCAEWEDQQVEFGRFEGQTSRRSSKPTIHSTTSDPDQPISTRLPTSTIRLTRSNKLRSALFGLSLSASASTAAAGPIRSTQQSQSTPTSSHSSSTIAPSIPSHTLIKRRATVIADKYDQLNGTWLPNSWSLNGRTGPTWVSFIHSSNTKSTATRPTLSATRVEDNLGRSTALISSPSASTTAPATRSIAPGNNHAAESSQTSISVPVGWKAPSRATKLYAVPVIITVSVLVALSLVATIVGSVVWRKRRRTRKRGKRLRDVQEGEKNEKGMKGRARKMVGRVRRRKPTGGDGAGDGEGGEGGAGLSRVGSGGSRRVATGIAVGSAGRLRERRRRRQERASLEGDGDDDEASEALTGGSRSVPETLTARVSARLRSNSNRQADASSGSQGPSTVFSGALERTDTHSSAGSRASLTRTASAYEGGDSVRTIASRSSANLSRELLDHQHSDVDDNAPNLLSTSTSRRQSSASLTGPGLPLPATSPSLATSTFGQFLSGVEAALPSFGPPAYRPNSTTIQATSRLTSSLLGRGARRQARRASVDEERGGADPDPLLWPEEKRALRARSRAAEAAASAPPAHAEEVESPPEHEAPAEPEIERSSYAAHIATDDKAILARLREHAEASATSLEDGDEAEASSSAPRVMAEASAPAVEDDEVDEEGFERMPQSIPTIVVDEPSLLPLPPQPVQTRSELSFGSPLASQQPSRAPSPETAEDQPRAGPSAVALGKRAEARRSAVDLGDEDGEDDEESFLPVYLPRAAAMASAPGEESDEDEAEEEGGEEGEEGVAGREGREEHAVI